MSDLSELKQILHYIMTENEDNYCHAAYLEDVEIPSFTKNIVKTVEFVKRCTADEFIAALREAAKKIS